MNGFDGQYNCSKELAKVKYRGFSLFISLSQHRHLMKSISCLSEWWLMACLFILEPTFFVLNPDGLESFSRWTQKFFNSVSYSCVLIMKQKKVGRGRGRGWY